MLLLLSPHRVQLAKLFAGLVLSLFMASAFARGWPEYDDPPSKVSIYILLGIFVYWILRGK